MAKRPSPSDVTDDLLKRGRALGQQLERAIKTAPETIRKSLEHAQRNVPGAIERGKEAFRKVKRHLDR